MLPWLVLGGTVTTLILCKSCRTSINYFLSSGTITILFWVLMWFGNEYLHEYLDEKIKWTRFPVKRLVIGLIVLMSYTVAVTFMITFAATDILHIKFNSASETLYLNMGITLIITVLLTSRTFLLNWRQTAIDAEKFQRESAVAKFESLRNQVNPHFLFNSLNALTNLVYEDQDKAVTFIKQLSDVYRYLLETRDKEIVPLADEEKFLKSYLFLQQIRFGEKLNLAVSLDSKHIMMPPLVLQMLVENAIKHNEISEDHPLYIKIYSDADFIIVENNIQKKKNLVEDSPGVGLNNICKRYEFLTDRKVEIHQDDKFIVRLPAIAPAL